MTKHEILSAAHQDWWHAGETKQAKVNIYYGNWKQRSPERGEMRAPRKKTNIPIGTSVLYGKIRQTQ